MSDQDADPQCLIGSCSPVSFTMEKECGEEEEDKRGEGKSKEKDSLVLQNFCFFKAATSKAK